MGGSLMLSKTINQRTFMYFSYWINDSGLKWIIAVTLMSKTQQIIINYMMKFCYFSSALDWNLWYTKEKQTGFNKKEKCFPRQKKSPINDTQKHFILFILQDQSPLSLWKTKPYCSHMNTCDEHAGTHARTYACTQSHITLKSIAEKCTQNIQSQDTLK